MINGFEHLYCIKKIQIKKTTKEKTQNKIPIFMIT